MKHVPTIINAILTTILATLLFSAGLPSLNARAAQTPQTAQPTLAVAATPAACDPARSVQVTGAATINVTPDRALIQLGVQSNGPTPDAVQIANTLAIQKVLLALQMQGIAAKDIATDIYIIEPVYESYDSLYIKGYRINNVVAITLRDVTKTSAVIAAALKAGANQVVNVEFYTSELRKYRDQARELAMTAAKEKAQALASAAGAGAGCVLNINENSWSYYNGGWYGRNQNNWTQNTIQNVAPTGSSGSNPGDEPISLGQIAVRAEVSATFALK